VTDEKGILIAAIERNEWLVAPPPGAWDRNYNENSLEVKDAQGEIVLQVWALPDRIQFQGKWWTDRFPLSPNKMTRMSVYTERVLDLGFGSTKSVLHEKAGMGGNVSIRPLFRYPSALHLGELAND
jgi:hypothetical protein